MPVHPRDEKGKDPVNLSNGVFVRQDKARKGERLERVSLGSGAKVKVLGDTPKEFRGPQLGALRAAVAPALEAHPLRAGVGGSGGGSLIAGFPG